MTMATSDVVVIGAGVFGAWTALLARRAGMSVTLVDAYGIGHPRATSGDETRIIRSGHADDAFYTSSARRARDAWRELGDEAGERLLVQAGVLWFADRDDGFEAASIRAFDAIGVPYERLDATAVGERWPQIAMDESSWALHEPEAGLLMARRGVMAAARLFSREGGRFELATAFPGASDGRTLLDVVAGDGSRLAGGSFVFACGPWLPRLFPEILGSLIRVTKQDVVFFGPPGGDGRFVAEWLPVWIDYDASYYGIPGVDGRGPKIAPDRYGPVFDPSSGERIVDPDSIRMARSYIGRRFPGLAGAPVVETRVCQYETTPDTNFVLDRHPDYDNVWLVGGGSGHGFKHGPMMGAAVVARLSGSPPGEGEERLGLAHPRLPATGLRTGGDSIATGFRGYG
jgi:glycine/D-amino acid oxidase-like deaminating enzyme